MMIYIGKQKITVRAIMFFLVAMFFVTAPASANKATDFDAFVESREIVATLYFDVDAEVLSTIERKRVANTVQQLRNAQKNGRMIRVEGFSSSEGDQEKNFILSFFRARSVADIIEAEGLDSEIALTGYGDLRADSKDHAKERRVEIASYIKPVGMKRVKVADNGSSPASLPHNSAQLKRDTQKIDSYRVDQAIRSRIEGKNDFAEQWDKLENSLQPGLSKSELLKKEIEHGYTLWRQSVAPVKSQKMAQAPSNDINRSFTRYIRSVTPANSVGVTQARKTDDALKRGYSQVKEPSTPDASPGLTQSRKVDDALKRGYSQVKEPSTPDASPGLTQSKKVDDELKRGYSQIKEPSTPDASPGLTQSRKVDDELKRGYSQVKEPSTPDASPGLTQSRKVDDELKRGYSQVKEPSTPDASPGLTQSRKVDDELKRGYSQVKEPSTPDASPGLTQSKKVDDELKRGYSQINEPSTPDASPGLTQSRKVDDALKRGYSQSRAAAALDEAPGMTMVVPQAPVIDALMIEQAIMEKIGVKPTVPSGSVTQIDVSYQQ